MHCHGASGAEAVGADVAREESVARETEVRNGLFNGCVDVGWADDAPFMCARREIRADAR